MILRVVTVTRFFCPSNLAMLRRERPHQQLEERRFSDAVLADDSQTIPGIQAEIEIIEDRPPALISERKAPISTA